MKPSHALLAAAVLLVGCGQKGPLYLPDTTQGEVVTRPAPTTGTAPPATDVDGDTRNKKTVATPPPPGK